ncbi:nuclear receptor coactivator 7 [Myxocyprinus asiaticus]|uniref:nuclear receptor coactivator 7 n=1 Tax=Myxocyprinus asiaticus TaxID=70543 RepID=UPI002223307C|nr:nuclear receptor coactivator 7 [Myxocyprinus asiaticus]
MDHRAQRDKNRASYFGNVKNRLGSKLPAGITQPPGFITAPCSIGAQGALGKSAGHHQIRNPKLRQYYLKEAAFPTKNLESCRNHEHGIPKNKASSSTEMASETGPRQEHSLDPTAGTATLVSPSTDAEYDKLTDVEAVPLPDGKVCLLALPFECSQGEGPEVMSCLKLFSRYITDRKGVVSGILLVTPNKIFFDPQKCHPLVQENGCEEYVFSCSVDDLTSVCFYTDISHVHFNKTSHRFNICKPSKSKKHSQSQKQTKCSSHQSALESSVSHDLPATLSACAEEEDEEGGESGDMAETERQLTLESGGILTVAADNFCCGGPDSVHRRNTEYEHTDRTKHQSCLHRQLLGPGTTTSRSGIAGSLMFVKIRQKQQHVKRRPFSKLKIPSRDAWFTMQQDSSDKLYAYLSQHRPDLCILEGGEDEEAEQDEEDFVLLDEEEQKEEEGSPREGRAEDWELVSVEESGLRASVSTEPDSLSHILNQSVILDAQQVKEISRELPPRTIGHKWQLSYSTDKHGASLKTLYRKLCTTDSPVLILIKDYNKQVFGTFLSHPLHPSDAFYGTGETFLFLSHPRFKCFRWTGENSFFIKGDLDSFAIGGGSGHFGLWVDERLYFGRSNPCFTFNNCSLSETNDFTILELEAWTFG